MIVFTATSVHSEQVYVGTARESVEEEWASLTSQAEAGASGEFFNVLRNHGVAGFTVEVWAFADSPGEARESMREAREELGAEAIRSSRSSVAAPAAKSTSKSSADAVKALLASLADDDGPVDDDAIFEAADWPGSAVADSAAGTAQDAASRSAGGTPAVISGQPQAACTAASATVESDAADDEARLLQRINMMKAAQARLLQEREAQRGGGCPAAAAPERLPDGRASSSSKEKRIREAIAEERERRDNQNQRRTQEQYAEMRDVLARIELRRIQTRKENSEKAKVARSRQVQAERRVQQAEKERQQAVRQKAIEAPAAAGATTEVAPPPGLSTPLQRSAEKPRAAVPERQSPPASEPPRRPAKGGSAAREKRIREAIAEERAAREMRQSQRRAAEADEMAEILGRLEERTKAAEKYKRRL